MPHSKENEDEHNIENKDTGKSCSYKDVVIIGNGPSALCLSYFLSGNWPYWNKNAVADEYLQMRLEYSDQSESLVEIDLEYLSDNLEGRSYNPVALLYDAMKQPNSDLGIETPTCLAWKYNPLNEIDHVVIGKASGAGGSWNDLDGSQLTISPSKWMELPNMSFTNWERQNKLIPDKANVNAGLVFSAKNSNFSEDKSLMNGNQVPKTSRSDSSYNLKKYLKDLNPSESTRATMNDVKNYYRDYVKQKNLDKYLLNNATVSSVRRICRSKLACSQNSNKSMKNCETKNCDGKKLEDLWEVTGLIDKRDRKKASSLSQGEICEFRFICKQLVLACGATDLHNTLNVKGENFRYILRTLRELEDKILYDSERLRKAPLLIVGAGLSAADAILLARKHKIKIIHVIRKSVNDPNLVFKTLPKNTYPEYHEVYEQMQNNRYNNTKRNVTEELNVLRQISQNDLNNNKDSNENNIKLNGKVDSDFDNIPAYTLYDEHQVKYFTSKRTCKLIKTDPLKNNSSCNITRHLQIQKQHHEFNKRQLTECDEEPDSSSPPRENIKSQGCNQNCSIKQEITEIKISFACILIGYSPDLDFLPPEILDNISTEKGKLLDTKDNPIYVNTCSHETVNIKNLYAMGPLIGDNFVRFGTGGALAICNDIVKNNGLIKKEENGGQKKLQNGLK